MSPTGPKKAQTQKNQSPESELTWRAPPPRFAPRRIDRHSGGMTVIAPLLIAAVALAVALVELMLLQVVREDLQAEIARAQQVRRDSDALHAKLNRVLRVAMDAREAQLEETNPRMAVALRSLSATTQGFAKSYECLGVTAPVSSMRPQTLWSRACRRLFGQLSP